MRVLWRSCSAFRSHYQLQSNHPCVLLFARGSSHPRKVSRVGFEDYEKERESYRLNLPKKFNFAKDVLEAWALEEESGGRDISVPAFWHVSESGKETKWTFGELVQESKKTANVLEQCGAKRGDSIFVMLPKIPEFWLVNVAAFRIGSVISAAATMLTTKDVAYRFSKLKPTCVVAHHSVAECIDEAIQHSNASFIKSKIVVGNKESERLKGWIDFESLQRNSSGDHKCADTDGDESLLVAFTSGTTGHPKMVEHVQANYCLGLNETTKYLYDLTRQSLIWNFCDTGWAKVFYASLIGPWMRGAGVFVHEMQRFSAPDTLKVLCDYPIDTFCAPPMAYRLMVQENLSEHKFKKLEHCISGGEALNLEVYKSWVKGTNLNIHEAYGQTETVMCIGMFKCIEYRPGSMGKPAPYLDVAILDDSGKELGPGQHGEIVLKLTEKPALGLFKGYKNDPELTQQKVTGKYFHTGDVAYRDEEGFYWFVMRKDDQINSAGYRIGPFEVESALMEHPAVVEAAVVSSPDSNRGEVVKAFVVLTDNYSRHPENELIKELQDYCRKSTAPYKYPRKIEFVKSLPKTISGKIMRFELKKKEWNNDKK